MSWTNMAVAPSLDGGDKEMAFEYTEILAGAGNTRFVLIPDDIQGVVVTAEASGTTVTVYSTTDNIATVKSGTGITWLAWAAGAISTATGASFNPVTAIYMVQAGAGFSKLTCRAQ